MNDAQPTSAPSADARKLCGRCGETKPLTEFYRDRSKRSGLSSGCKPCCADKRDEWRAKNPERHREHYLAEAKRHYHNNREYHAEKNRRRRETRRDAIWLVDWLKRCRVRGLDTDDQTREYAAILIKDPCAYCGKQPAYGIDHIVPIIQGGAHHWENLTAACGGCNGAKQVRSLSVALLSRID